MSDKEKHEDNENSKIEEKVSLCLLVRSDYRIRLNGDWDMDIPKVAWTTLAEIFVNTIITLST